MDKFVRKSKDEIRKMTEDEFCSYMEEWDKYSEEKRSTQKITEAEMPKFDSIEAVRKYYGGITFDEFEQKLLKQYDCKDE